MRISTEETRLQTIDGVQVYARKNDAAKPAEIDAIDLDKAKIDAIAERALAAGYGVMRQTKNRAGKVRYLLKAHGPARASRRTTRSPGPDHPITEHHR